MGQDIGFLFDNDGVLIDSSALHWESWQLLMQEDPSFFIKQDQFIHGFGKRNDLILKEILPHVSQEQHQKWAKRKEELFRKCARDKITLLPGMEPFLKKIKEKNIPRIIASSTPIENLQMFLESTVLGKYFDQFVSAEQVAHGKPAPDVFLAAAKQIGMKPFSCIVLEDAPAGIEAGKKAGCFVIALETTHSKSVLRGYDLLYASPHDLDLEWILNQFTSWEKNQL